MTPLQEFLHIYAELLRWCYRHPLYILGAIALRAAYKAWVECRREGK